MSAPNDGGPAFPGLNAEFTGISSDGQERYDIQPSGGMTLRDYFAAMAMQGFLAQSCGTAGGSDPQAGAQYAYAMADAMLKAREVKP